jgi:hypothetical protein
MKRRSLLVTSTRKRFIALILGEQRNGAGRWFLRLEI